MIHYSWDPKTKRFSVYLDSQLLGKMWWDEGQVLYTCIEERGSNSIIYKELYKLMERIEREQFGK